MGVAPASADSDHDRRSRQLPAPAVTSHRAVHSGIPLSDLAAGVRLLWQLPRFLRQPVTSAEALASFRQQLADRDRRFLTLMRAAVYQQASSPFRRLLTHVGCDYGDLGRLVEQEGLDGALASLAARGVYLSVEEYKRRRLVVRGSLRFEFRHADLYNPLTRPSLPLTTSGSRQAVDVPTDLRCVKEKALADRVILDTLDVNCAVSGEWNAPGSWVIRAVLTEIALGCASFAWFSPVDLEGTQVPARYRWSTRLMRWSVRPFGISWPAPVFVPPQDPVAILDWIGSARRAGHAVRLKTLPRLATSLVHAAAARDASLRGGWFFLGAEPTTGLARSMIEASGARLVVRYGSMECPGMASGCMSPIAADDVHLVQTGYAVVPAPSSTGLPENAVLISALVPSSPIILLNTSLGDSAVIERRSCGCPMEALGLTTHISQIRSFEKLTSAGWKILDVDLVRVLDELLPGRCGGRPGDYQLVEDAGPDGNLRLRLLVSPSVAVRDLDEVRRAFLDIVGSASSAQRLTTAVWESAGVLTVERREPYPASSGKVLHLHVVDQR